ncbi:MAG: type II CAAX prenyl endopeptidase Rce1 family protein [Actinomycetota bacterium]
MIFLLMALGGLAQIWAWRLVAVRFLSIWTATVPALATCGLAALVTERVSLSPKVSVAVAGVVGVVAGFALYASTRAFLLAGRGSPMLRRASSEVYAEQRTVPTPLAVVLSLAFAVPGEELFWRGLFQGRASGAFGAFGGAALAWICYVLVNASSGFLALVAGALVGGATWGALAWWTHGVLAPLLCHGIWTTLMLVRPPVARRAGAVL